MKNELYYRPEWTCGRYNATKHVAIMFNLISNGEYFFENESADVIGVILKAGRNGEVSIANLSETLNITKESMAPFFKSLMEIGLLSDICPTESDINAYRNLCIAQPNKTTYIGENAEHYLQCDISTVEQAYSEAVRDCTEVTSVVFELTYRCSEKCLHCYNVGATRNDSEVSGRGSLAELTLEEYKRIIDEMYDAGLVTATLTGGDPFANKNVWNILEYLYEKDVAVTILTNGQQLTNQIDRLANLYPRSVRLSLYAADSKAHDYITRKDGSWQITIDVIRALKTLSIPVIINCVLMRPGVKSYMGLKSIAENMKCPIIFDYGVVDSIEGDVCATHHLRLTPQELEIVLLDSDIEPNILDYDVRKSFVPAIGVPCMAGRGTFDVTPDGKLIPCISMHLVLGDLKKQNFHLIIQDNTKLKILLKSPESKYVGCGKYNYCKCCIFCAGNSFSEHGSPFSANENNCYLAKNRYKIIEKIKSGMSIPDNKAIYDCIAGLPEYTFPKMHIEYRKVGK